MRSFVGFWLTACWLWLKTTAFAPPPKISLANVVSPISTKVRSRPTTLYSNKEATATEESRLKDCICLVTGASRGIGKGIAVELGKQGAVVYVTGTSSTSNSNKGKDSKAPYTTTEVSGGPGTIEETAAEITDSGGKGIAVYCNHAVDTDVEKLMALIRDEHGRLDILINNVFRLPEGGTEQLNKKFWEQSPEVWDTLHTVGLRSHYVASYYAMPLLFQSAKDDGDNRRPKCLPRPFIGMISSFGGNGYTFNMPYGVAKAGVDRMAKDMALELTNTDNDMCVVSFYPGLVNTERTQISVENGNWQKYVGLPLDNSETPNFTGKAIVAVATDPDNTKKSGSVQVVAELAEEYGFRDINGQQPPSIRSLRFLLHSYAFSNEQRRKIRPDQIPNWKLPFWFMAQGPPPSQD